MTRLQDPSRSERHRSAAAWIAVSVVCGILLWLASSAHADPTTITPNLVASSVDIAVTAPAATQAAVAHDRSQVLDPHRRDAQSATTIMGRVVAAESETPLLGASVDADGESKSALIDPTTGSFVVTVPRNDRFCIELRIRSIGYESVVLPIAVNCALIQLGDIKLRQTGSVAGVVQGTALPRDRAYEIHAELVWSADGTATSAPHPGNGGEARIVVADRANEFTFEGLVAGRWRVSVALPEIPACDVQVEVAAGGRTWIDLPGPSPADLLAGIALDEHGRAVSGVHLTTENGAATGGTVTGIDGEFLLCRRADHRPTIPVQLRGWDREGTGGIVDGPARNTVSWGDQDARIVFPRLDAHVVQVRANDGRTIADCTVTAHFWAVGAGPLKVGPLTASAAQFRLVGVPAGPCLLRVSAPPTGSLAGVEAYCEIPAGGGGVTNVVLTRSIDRIGHAALADGRAIAGRIVRFYEPAATSTAAAQLRERLGWPAQFGNCGEAVTDDRGDFTVDLPDRSDLQAILEPITATRQQHPHRVPVYPEPIVLTEPTGAILQGHLGGESFRSFLRNFHAARPQASRWSLRSFGPAGRQAEATIEVDGSYHFVNLDAGDWTVFLRGPAGSFQLDRLQLIEATKTTRDYECDAFVPSTVELAITLDGEPAAGAELHLSNNRMRETIGIGRNGSVSTVLPPGSYSVRLVLHVGSPEETWLDRRDRLQVAVDTDARTLLSFARRRAILEIMDRDGHPAADRKVTIDVERRAGRWRTYRTDGDGRINLPCAPDGEFGLICQEVGEAAFAKCRIQRDGEVVRVHLP